MNTAMRRAALCLTTAIGAAIASPSFAQEDATLDTVIVTARRTDERLQDVPISITVFNQDQLNKRNIISGADLQTYTPSLTANSTLGTNTTTFAIRGFTQESRTTSSVGVYFADVIAPRGGNGGTPVGDGAGPGNFFDLQNVQVLKGPQGTLFGRNTTGGAILLVPQKPTREFEGYVEGSVGNYDMRRLQAVVNIPLAETARLRLGMDTYERDGYIKNIGVAGPSHMGDDNFTAFRASFVADVTPDLENYTIATYSRSYNTGPIRKFTQCADSFPFGLLCQQQMARQANDGFYTVQNYLPNPRSVATQYQVINTTTWHASDNLTVKNIISFSRIKSNFTAEVFGGHYTIPQQFGPIPNTGPFAGLTFGFAQIVSPLNSQAGNQENFTEELQFQGKAFDSRLTWQGGAYYEESNPVGLSGAQSPVLLYCSNRAAFQCTDVVGTLLGIPGRVSSMNYVQGEVSFKNLGVYGQGTYDLTDKLKLTGGIRYTHDVTRATARQVTYRFFTPNVPTGFCTLNIAQLAPTPDACSTTTEQRSHKPTWVLGLDYKPVDEVLLYGKYSRGYRQGAVNFSAPVLFQTYGPEKVDTYEVGAKTSFRGAVSGSLNISAFYNDFTNQQLGVSLASSTGAVTVTQAIINGGKSRIYGVELDGSLSPFQNFRLDVGYAYLNTRLQKLTPIALPPGSAFDLIFFGATEGSRLPYTPAHKATATATYTIPLGDDVGRVDLGATYSYTSNTFIQVGDAGTIKSVALLNLNADWKNVAGKPIDLSLFVTNVFDKEYYTTISDLRSSSGFVAQPFGLPRMYGMRLRYRFGD